MEPQSLWYLALFAIGIVIIIAVIVDKKEAMLVSFYYSIVGLAFMFEYFIKIVFESYVYYPKLLENRYYDDILGANASQGFAVPCVAFLVAVYRLSLWWIFLLTGIFAGIEEFFLSIGIYDHHWWRTWYTSAILIPIFWIFRKWLTLLKGKDVKWIRFVTLILASFSIHGSLFFYSVIFLNTHAFHVGWVGNEARDNLLFSILYFLPISIYYSVIAYIRAGSIIKILAILLVLCVDWTLWKLHIIEIYKSWSPLYFPIAHIVVMSITIWMYHTLHSNQEAKEKPVPS